MATNQPQAAHFLEDLNVVTRQQLPEDQFRTIVALCKAHAAEVFAYLNSRVFPYRVRHHNGPSVQNFEAPANAYAVIPQSRLLHVDVTPRMAETQHLVELLQLEGRLDQQEILLAMLNITGKAVKDLHDLLSIPTDHHTQASLRMDPAPEKEILCCDMDGVLAVLRLQDPASEGVLKFRHTRLGHAVHHKAMAFLEELHEKTQGQRDISEIDTETALLPLFIQNFGDVMERDYGAAALDRTRQIFVESYPRKQQNLAVAAAEFFIRQMPMAYHVFRHKMWDHDLHDIYELDQTAGAFSVRVQERGGRLIFITAAPRIHALKMLKACGVMDAVGPTGFQLFTVEDMYQTGTVEDATYLEGDKGMILERIHQERGIPKHLIAMAGDQYNSDVRPAIDAGVQSRIIRGPEELDLYLASVRLPRQRRSS